MTFPASVQPHSDVQRVLCVFAHPDDVDFGSAGTVAHWVDEGLEVSYLLVTRGDTGGFDDRPRDQMPIAREAEQRAAAAAVGVKQVEFLDGYSDGSVEPTLALRKDLVAAIRRYRPDRILTSSPLRRWTRLAGPSHPDHLAVGEALTCAVYPDARNEFAHMDLNLDPWTVREIWYSGGPDPDFAVNITETFDRKLAALRAHASQTTHMSNLEEMLRTWLTRPDGSLAEMFTVIHSA